MIGLSRWLATPKGGVNFIGKQHILLQSPRLLHRGWPLYGHGRGDSIQRRRRSSNWICCGNIFLVQRRNPSPFLARGLSKDSFAFPAILRFTRMNEFNLCWIYFLSSPRFYYEQHVLRALGKG